MADKSKLKIVNSCELNLTAIITALHENALSKVTDKDVRIANSAVSKDGKLRSAGELIIAAMSAKENDERITKSLAVKSLLEYCTWFVGPDLAKKINDNNVLPLGDSEKTISESSSLKSFLEFLDEDNSYNFISPDDSDSENSSSADSVSDSEDDDPTKKDFSDGLSDDLDKAKREEDNKQEGGIGYYITYNLKVEGLKQSALADAMKDFASTFFDDVKITASGLFGGGSSFTIKDIKDAIKTAFGSIDDPDELISAIKDEFRKKFPEVSDKFDVVVRDKTTLDLEIKDFDVDAQERKKIQQADYSFVIDIHHDEAYSKMIDKRSIADLITSSIKGIFKRFKYAVTANDIVLVQNFIDSLTDTEKVTKLNLAVPKPEDIKKFISDTIKNDKKEANSILSLINSKFEALKKEPRTFLNSKLALKVYLFWNDLKNNKGWYKKLSDDLTDDTTWYNKFSDDIHKFVSDYTDKYKTEYSAISEETSIIDRILELLFNDYSDYLSILADSDDSTSLNDINKKLKSDAEDLMILNSNNPNWQHSANTFAGTPLQVKKYLDKYKLLSLFDFNKLDGSKYAAVIVVKIPKTVGDKTYSGSIGNKNFTDDAVHTLFKGVLKGDFTVDKFIGNSTTLVYNKSKLLADYKVFIAEFNNPEVNDEKTPTPTPSTTPTPEPSPTPTFDDSDSESSSSDEVGIDRYIIPMPGMKFKKDEEK